MITLQQAKEQIAKEQGWGTWAKLTEACGLSVLERRYTVMAAELYKQESCRETWDRACEAVENEADHLGRTYIRPNFKP